MYDTTRMFVVLKGSSALSNKLINNESNNIFDNIKEFLLELGKGFMFVGS